MNFIQFIKGNFINHLLTPTVSK